MGASKVHVKAEIRGAPGPGGPAVAAEQRPPAQHSSCPHCRAGRSAPPQTAATFRSPAPQPSIVRQANRCQPSRLIGASYTVSSGCACQIVHQDAHRSGPRTSHELIRRARPLCASAGQRTPRCLCGHPPCGEDQLMSTEANLQSWCRAWAEQHRGPGGGAAGASARKCAERLACRSSACCTCSTVSSSREPLAAARRPPVCRRDASGRSPAAKQGGRACSRPNDVLTDALAGGTPALHNACLA